ncbi:MAG: DUF4388 domain-containing protein [Vicinamibacteria bacterium]|jgi:hypothetical protein|nr:DUF4388 domain-containing protein [Vicinamibacteria bacterium]MBP9947701.1 DUF4388 domain-containing protein [Vicinamibacteria bacterium]
MLSSFQGLIGYVEIPDLFTFVHLGRRTGVTELTKPGQLTRVFFQKGNPVFATSDKEGLRLGDLLLRLGRISRKDLDRCMARYRVGGPHLGQVFVSDGLLTIEELTSHLKVQISEVIFDTFGWTQGSFAFYDDVSPPPDAVTLQMDIQNLLMEGVRRMDERGRLAEVFPDLDAAVQVLGDRESMRENLNLTPEEWRILFLIDGRRSLREVCQLDGNPDELAPLEVLKRLFGGNLVGFAAARPPSPELAKSSTDANATVVTPREQMHSPITVPKGQSLTQLEALGLLSAVVAPEVQARVPSDARERSDADVVINPKAVMYASETMALWARLLLSVPDGKARSFPLTMETQTLGRGLNNNIVIADPVVSTFHARIDRTREGFRLVDLTSKNGTFVNGSRVSDTLLRPHDVIQVGDVKLTYLED